MAHNIVRILGLLFVGQELRTQWEYSHATSAVLNLIAFIALALAVLPREPEPS